MVIPNFRVRLNGIIISEIELRTEMAHGKPSGHSRLAVCDPQLGWFTLDDDEDVLQAGVARCILEYRNEAAWAEADPVQRRMSRDKGWRRITPRALIALLRKSGCLPSVEPEAGDAPLASKQNRFAFSMDSVATQLREDAERLGPNRKELEQRMEELLQRLEFAAMLRGGRVLGRDPVA